LYREHVSRKFEKDLQNLRNKILQLGEMVSNAIAQAVISLKT